MQKGDKRLKTKQAYAKKRHIHTYVQTIKMPGGNRQKQTYANVMMTHDCVRRQRNVQAYAEAAQTKAKATAGVRAICVQGISL